MAYLESRWIEAVIGDILYAPALVKHGPGKHKDAPPMNSSGCATPAQFDLYEKAGYLAKMASLSTFRLNKIALLARPRVELHSLGLYTASRRLGSN